MQPLICQHKSRARKYADYI